MERWILILPGQLSLVAHEYIEDEVKKTISVRDRFQYTMHVDDDGNELAIVRLMPANDSVTKLVSRENEPDEIKLSEYCAIFGKTIADTISTEEKNVIINQYGGAEETSN